MSMYQDIIRWDQLPQDKFYSLGGLAVYSSYQRIICVRTLQLIVLNQPITIGCI